MNKLQRIGMLLLVIIIGIIAIIFLVLPGSKKATTASVTPTTNTTKPTSIPTKAPSTAPDTKECQPEQVKTLITAEGAAGSTYGKMELTNTADAPCQITLGNTITAKLAAANIEVHFQQKDAQKKIMLDPSKKVYSQVRYPNGAQCTSKTTQLDISFYYQRAVRFATADNKTLKIQACKSPTEKTTVEVWPVSNTPYGE